MTTKKEQIKEGGENIPSLSLAERVKAALKEGRGEGVLQRLAPPPDPKSPAAQVVHAVRRQQALLLDCSASMREDAGEGKTKWEALRSLLPQFGPARRFAFGSRCLETAALPQPNGSTDMADAFATLKRAGIRHAVLITDGEPDDENAALREARGLRLDIFYVGPPPAPPFLARLAKATGGTAHTSSLRDAAAKRLVARVKEILALPPGKD